jgi:heme exporter protein B
MFTLALTAPALAAYVTLAGALLCGRQGAAFLAILLVMPFLIPLLIFGLEATQAVLTSGWTAPEIRILFGLTLLSIAIGLPASSAALRINLEPS